MTVLLGGSVGTCGATYRYAELKGTAAWSSRYRWTQGENTPT
jgi:hypothetical protein